MVTTHPAALTVTALDATRAVARDLAARWSITTLVHNAGVIRGPAEQVGKSIDRRIERQRRPAADQG